MALEDWLQRVRAHNARASAPAYALDDDPSDNRETFTITYRCTNLDCPQTGAEWHIELTEVQPGLVQLPERMLHAVCWHDPRVMLIDGEDPDDWWRARQAQRQGLHRG